MEEPIVYLARAYWGSWDDKGEETVYAGLDYEKAKKAMMYFSFPDGSNNFGYIEFWQGGEKIKNNELVRE